MCVRRAGPHSRVSALESCVAASSRIALSPRVTATGRVVGKADGRPWALALSEAVSAATTSVRYEGDDSSVKTRRLGAYGRWDAMETTRGIVVLHTCCEGRAPCGGVGLCGGFAWQGKVPWCGR